MPCITGGQGARLLFEAIKSVDGHNTEFDTCPA